MSWAEVFLARPERLELPTYWFEASRSIRLSYGRVRLIVSSEANVSAHANLEVEVKIPFAGGADAARRLIETSGYRLVEPRTFESNTLFDLDSCELRLSGRLLRLRISGKTATVTYKGPAESGRYKSREEIEFNISNSEAFEAVLDRLGYHRGFQYEKYRTTFGQPDEEGDITIDETPMGVFLELEGSPEWIDKTASRLGFPQEAYITSSYGTLYREYRLTHPSVPENMTF